MNRLDYEPRGLYRSRTIERSARSVVLVACILGTVLLGIVAGGFLIAAVFGD